MPEGLVMWFVAWSWVAGAEQPLAPQMHERFSLLTEIRDELVQGRLAEAKVAGTNFASFKPTEPLPTAAAPFLAQLSAEAGKVSAAADLGSATKATARIAQACAGCHDATNGGPSLDRAGDIPKQVWEPGSDMARHAWALDWLWLGLLSNDDPAWIRGAEELGREPIESRLRALATKAAAIPLAERADLYGTLLATCASCHLEKPPPPKK